MTVRVGFDLDMTLIDASAPIADLLDEVGAELGLPVDGSAMAAALGPPLETRLAESGFGARDVGRIAGLYRERYPVVVPRTVALPGAEGAVRAVHDAGGRVIVVTGKATGNARLHVERLGWPVQRVQGDVFAAGKAAALQEFGASVYVGDHMADMVGATAAGATAVGVPTGPCTAEELRDAGADHVLGSLTEFPALLGALA